MLNVNSPLFIAMATVFATAGLGLFGWSIQRVIRRVDGIGIQLESLGRQLEAMGRQLEAMGSRLNVVELAQARASRARIRNAAAARKVEK